MVERRVWAILPSADADRLSRTVNEWRLKGYEIAVQVDDLATLINASSGWNYRPDFVIICEYDGYPAAINRLVRAVGDQADVFCAIGDDMNPCENFTAREMAERYFGRFPEGDGVWQPAGDPQGSLIDGKANAARICGSPWFGHNWDSGFGGPQPTGYHHFYADETIKCVAEARGKLWMDMETMQEHRHWSFTGEKPTTYQQRNQEFWSQDKALFEERKARGWQ